MTKYYGGKKRLAKILGKVILEHCKDQKIDFYYEPFAGMYSVGFEIMNSLKKEGKDITFHASDHKAHLITFWNALSQGWFPPESYEEYLYLKETKREDSPLHVCVGYSCGFNGIYFGGTLKEDRFHVDYRRGRNCLLKLQDRIPKVRFEQGLFTEVKMPQGIGIIYCDPPYSESKISHKVLGKNFDKEAFWEQVNKWSKTHIVFVSETVAPIGWQPLWEKECPRAFNTPVGSSRKPRRECLFHRPSNM